MTRAATLLVAGLRDPAIARGWTVAEWTDAIAVARAERLLASLALRVDRRAAPEGVAMILADAEAGARADRRAALWEAEMAQRALAPLGAPVVLLKGTAYAAAGLDAGQGRAIGDLDILVPRAALPGVEAALLAAGWEWVKPDPYDDAYYRRWMHELPPLIHRARDRMIDVHHTILPLTARPMPDAAALLAGAVLIGEGLAMLSPADMLVHAAAHLIADGDLAGGLRNVWDIDRLVREFVEAEPGFLGMLELRARHHGLWPAVRRACGLARTLYGTPVPSSWRGGSFFVRRLLARDGWGRQRRPATRLAFYVRSHWLRMPPLMLARHLLTKARR